MKRIVTGGVVALGALMLGLGASSISAQDEPDQERRRGIRRGASVEAIMSMRERLTLTEEQIAALDEIRRETVERRSGDAAAMAEMRSRLQAGQIRQSEMMAFIEERRDARSGVAEDRSQQIEGILNEAQLAALQEIGARSRAFRSGRANARRGGRGFRGARGSRGVRGSRGARGSRAWRGPRGARGFTGAALPGFQGRSFREGRGARFGGGGASRGEQGLGFGGGGAFRGEQGLGFGPDFPGAGSRGPRGPGGAY